LHKQIENVRQDVGPNSSSFVLDFDDSLVSSLGQRQPNLSRMRAEFRRVVKQVRNDLRQPRRIGVQIEWFARERDEKLLAVGIDHGLRDFRRVFSFASGTSFHQQIFPDATLSLGFSATAMHWLSRLPATLGDHVHVVGAHGAIRDAFAAQAAADWETILLHRARELVPGGQLVLANLCIDEAGRYSGGSGGHDTFGMFARHWRTLYEDGTITSHELHRATFVQYFRTIPEFRAPFDDPASAVSRAGLVLEHCSSVLTPVKHFTAGAQDAATYAREFIASIRAFSESTFLDALEAGRPQTEREAIVDRFYAAYEAEVAATPEDHRRDAVHCFMRVAKVV